jgi:hypothetical protein
MAISSELFRFLSVRRPERVAMHHINSRLIRDLRPATPSSMLVLLFGQGSYDDKLPIADGFSRTAEFLRPNVPEVLAVEQAVDFFRSRLAPGLPLVDLLADLSASSPGLGLLLQANPSPVQLLAAARFVGRAWDSFYAEVIRGFDRFLSTNYLADILRVFHVLRIVWLSQQLGLTEWSGATFDEYEILIDTERAFAAGPGDGAAEQEGGTTRAPRSASLGAMLSQGGQFRVPLGVGKLRPPLVGDLLLVEQELRAYELGELAEIESIMRGERRERTTRHLTRTSQTTATETTSEREDSQSIKTDERFQLSSQAQQAASQSTSITAGVNVTGKFGPVQVGASVNASFSTSQSSSAATSQEFARTVTEEASKRIRESVKQSSSVTFLTEMQKTSLQGFNNEKGTEHVNGLYRWVDKILTARMMNYGRRQLLDVQVPEPAAFFRSLMAQNEAVLLEGLEEPLHPSDLGYPSYQAILENNYANLAARYDVTNIEPPPPGLLHGSKAIVYPEAMQAEAIPEHDHPNDLSYVSADNTLTVNPDYVLTEVGVYVPTDELGGWGGYADVLKMGEDKDEANRLLVQVGDKSFHFVAIGHGNDPRTFHSIFNDPQAITEGGPFSGMLQAALPITITANFEGIFTIEVMYTARLSDEALDRWKAQTYAAIIKGFERKQQTYEQAVQLANSKMQSEVEARTYQLREEQYREIELTELKRGCIELLTAGTGIGFTSIVVESDGSPRIVFDEAEAGLPTNFRSPLANGAVAAFFETVFDWKNVTYQLHPYYWTDSARWTELMEAGSADPVFEQFLKAGSASVVVPVTPGYERAVTVFLKTGLTWAGGYCPLFTSQDMLELYADVELGEQLDPPEQVGDSWEVRLPTTMIMLQEDSALPTFPPEDTPADESTPTGEAPIPDESVPF